MQCEDASHQQAHILLLDTYKCRTFLSKHLAFGFFFLYTTTTTTITTQQEVKHCSS